MAEHNSHDLKPVTSVTWDVSVHLGKVVTTLRAPGIGALPITVDPQAAFEMGEKLARAAHEARFGEPLQSDVQYLAEQIKKRATEDWQAMMLRRLHHVARSRDVRCNVPLDHFLRDFLDIVLSQALPG